MNRILYILAWAVLLSCSSLVPDESVPLLMNYEKNTYTLKETVSSNKREITAGSRVKIKIVLGDEWIKVYAFGADEDVLSSERVLAVYLFADEFDNEKFDMARFEVKLFEKLNISGS